MPVAFVVYVIALLLVALILIRIAGRKKTGAGRVKFEVLYLLVYSFLGGVVSTYMLVQKEMFLVSAIVVFVFLSGLVLRVYPLFKLISDVERVEMERS